MFTHVYSVVLAIRCLSPRSVGGGLNMDDYSLPADALSQVGSGGGFMV